MSLFQIRGFARAGTLEALTVPARGRCSVCRAYDSAFSPAGLRDDLTAFELVMEQTPAPRPAAVVAVSGGKDSLSTLYLASAVRRWRVAACLFDNGFIPQAVLAQVRRVCAQLKVPLHIERFAPRAGGAFAREVAQVTATNRTPCDTCALALNSALGRLCRRLGIRQVIFGTNFYASWLDRPSALTFTPGPNPLTFLNLPYALGVTASQTRRNVARLGATVHRFNGGSSNCRVPEVVQRRVGRTLGHQPELEVLSLEVMVGHLPRAAALAALRQPGRS